MITYLNEIPDIFKKRGGTDKRRPRSEATVSLVRFANSDENICLCTLEDEAQAKAWQSTINSYENKHRYGVRVMRRDNLLLLVKKIK